MKNDFQPVVGHDFQFRAGAMPDLDFDGIIYCKVLEIVPFKKLSYSWKSGPGKGTINLESVVKWTLQPKDNGTELFLEHIGFEENVNIGMFTAMQNGWLKNIQKISTLIKN